MGQQRPLEAQHPPTGQFVTAGQGQGGRSPTWLYTEDPGAVVARPRVQRVRLASRDTLGTRPVNICDLWT